MPYAPQGVKGPDDDDAYPVQWMNLICCGMVVKGTGTLGV
jgi:hypothetical protein